MRYKREEGFRYNFKQPLPTSISIYKNNNEIQTFKGEIIDISLGGAKIRMSLDVKIDLNLKVLLTISLNDLIFKIIGNVRWANLWMNGNSYGILYDIDEETREKLLKEIKEYAKRDFQESKNGSM
jgi:hypothetical protein